MPTIFVAHYGHPLLKGAKHWSFLVPIDNQLKSFLAYQITGSTQTYTVMDPEIVSLEKSQSFMGKVAVGHIDDTERNAFQTVVLAVPATLGNMNWNCQNWIIEALREAKQNGFNVNAYNLQQLQDLLAN